MQLLKCKYIKKSFFRGLAKKVMSYICYAFLLKKSKKPASMPPKNSIAVVFLAALGDMIVFCDAAKKLKTAGKNITLICISGNGAAEFARITGLFDKIIEVDVRGKARAENLKMLKQIEVNTVFCTPLGRHILPDLYACAISAERRYFPDTMLSCSLPLLKKRVDSYADKLVPITQTHELKRYTQFLAACELCNDEIKPFRLDMPKADRGNTLAVFPGAGGGTEKQWGIQSFADVILTLLKKELIDKVLIFGTQFDSQCCDDLFKLLKGKEAVENLCGKTDINQLIEILGKCRISLTNDSAGAHLSVACGVPTVTICGMWQFGRFYPNPDVVTPFVSVDNSERFCQTCNSSKPMCGIYPAPCLHGIEPIVVAEYAASLLKRDERNR